MYLINAIIKYIIWHIKHIASIPETIELVIPKAYVIYLIAGFTKDIKAIIIAGIENVRKLYPRKFSHISQNKKSYSNTEISDGIYLWHHSNTTVKAKELKKISRKYNLNWEVIIEK